MELFYKEHSVFGREAIVIEDREIVRKFIKDTNKHCFPIFPRYNPTSKWRHPFNIMGWGYWVDCSDVVLRELEVPRREAGLQESGSEDLEDFPLPSAELQPFTAVVSNYRLAF